MTWVFSHDPDIEAAIEDVRCSCPPLLPAGLARVKLFYAALGDPQLSLPPVFHVAGTNGKGSVLAFLQAFFEAGGKSVHKFTSPHLVDFRERVVLNGRMIEKDALLPLVEECIRAVKGRDVSFFEFFTGLCFLAFHRVPADAVLLETGLGGLLDATNVLEGTVPVITRISYDHTHILGKRLEEIAAQKAGILRPGRTGVVASQAGPGVMETIEAEALRIGAKLFRAGKEWTARAQGSGFVYESAAHKFTLPPPALLGAHQVENAGAAIAALEVAGRKDLLTEDILSRGLRAAVWPARMQRLAKGPLMDALPGREIWLDGAHNDSGAEALAKQIESWGAGPVDLLTAMKGKKESAAFYAPLKPHVARLRVLDADIGAEMSDAVSLCAALRADGFADVGVVKDLETAAQSFSSQNAPARRILVAGSLYLAGYVLRSHS